MAREITSLQAEDTLRSAVEAILVQRIRHLPVVDAEGKLIGIFTDRDLKHALPSPLTGLSPEERESLLDETTLERLMTRDPLTLPPDAPLQQAVELMLQKKIGGIPVCDPAGRVVGMLTQSDALRALLGVLE